MDISDINLVLIYGAPGGINQLHQVRSILHATIVCDGTHVCVFISYVAELDEVVSKQELTSFTAPDRK